MSVESSNPASSAADQMRERLLTCEDEPIRIPGSIQQHGFLLLLDAEGEHIVAASQNAETFLNLPLHLLLGAPVDTVLEREILRALRSVAADTTAAQGYLGSFPLRGALYSVVTHLVGEERVLEFEVMDRLVSPEMANLVFTNFVSRLSVLRDEQALCDALAEQVKLLTGFNRIMLYRFDEFGHGTVLSEQNDGTLPSYLDLRFPASDIPRQARELYILNTVRIIPDAGYVPSPLHALGNRPIAALDLSMSILRSVSPIHVEYMRNMGTLSSMSVSLVCDGKLWGLIGCHHATPHMVPYVVRSACDLLSKLVCTQLMNLWASASLKQMVQFHSVQRNLIAHTAAEPDHLAVLAGRMDEVVRIADAAGAALVVEYRCHTHGDTPPLEAIRRLTNWLDARPELELFHSRHLAEDIPWTADFSEAASGLLAIRISQVSRTYLLWFRPEVIRTVQWAGQPKSTTSRKDLLNPRTSFEQWKESVRGTSIPWTEMEIQSAADFRAAITTVGLKRAEEAVKLGESRFFQLTHSLPNPVWTATDDGHLTYVNQRWLEQGLTPEGLWYNQEAILKEDRERCAALWASAIAEAKPFEFEMRICTEPERTERWNLVRAVPYLAAGQQSVQRPAGWVGSFTDLTDRRQREAALRMSEKLALTGRMTSFMAHEINNPLEALTNLLFLLRDYVQHDESARTWIGMAEGELQRISGITKQTLRWSKEGAGKPSVTTAGEIFADVMQLFSARIRNRGVHVVIESGADTPIYGTIGQITQVIVNLVSNAVQAVHERGHVWLCAATQGDTTEIVVRDEGHGMSEETLRNLFQPFYSTKGDYGNGLGLYISQEIVERHSGTLTVKSELNVGTEVRVTLPAADGESQLSSLLS